MIVDRTAPFDPSKLEIVTEHKQEHYFLKNDEDPNCLLADEPICVYKVSGRYDSGSLSYNTSYIDIIADAQTWLTQNCHLFQYCVNGEMGFDAYKFAYMVYLYDYEKDYPSKVLINNGYIAYNRTWNILPLPSFRGLLTTDKYTNAVVVLYGQNLQSVAEFNLYKMTQFDISYRYDHGDWNTQFEHSVEKISTPIDVSNSEGTWYSNDIRSFGLQTSWTPHNIYKPEDFNIITTIDQSPGVYYVNPDLTNYQDDTLYTNPEDFLVLDENQDYTNYYIN